MQQNAPNGQSFITELPIVDQTACGFAHEFCENVTQCHATIRARRHGCAHNKNNYVVLRTIEDLSMRGILSADTVASLRAVLDQQSSELQKLDLEAALESIGEGNTDAAQRNEEQRRIIQERQQMTDTLFQKWKLSCGEGT